MATAALPRDAQLRQHELILLRQTAVPMVATPAAFIAWIWVNYALMKMGALTDWGAISGPLALLALSSAALWVNSRSTSLATLMLLLGITAAAFSASWITFSGLGPYALSLAVSVAGLLFHPSLGLWTALLASLLIGAAGTQGLAGPRSLLEIVRPIGLLWLTATVSFLSAQSLYHAIEWARNSQDRATRLLDELRDRQGQLNRTLRAMEEATYRIERMNNELLLAQSEALAARTAKSRFAATVSHEIRGPLGLILGFSESMALSPERYGGELAPAFYADADAIYRNAQHLHNLVDDVLDLSRIETDQLPLVKDQIDFEQDIVAKAVESVRPLAERRGLTLRMRLRGDLPWIYADPVRLRQGLLNLLLNAVRFTERGGVTVVSTLENDSVVVRVEDTGPGIPAKDLPLLFREFQQIRNEARRGQGGSGLGLSITKHLVEAHGGRVGVESKLGMGTSISFSVPLPGQASGASPLKRTAPADHRATEHRHCLVIHDDQTIVNALARHLPGFRIVGLSEGSRVAELVEELRPRAIVASVEAADSVRQALSGSPFDVPVISCTLPRAGAQPHLDSILGYLLKPVESQTLEVFLRKVDGHDGLTVLIVDDEPEALRLMEYALASLPYKCRTLKAADGGQALDLMQATRPDIVFLDWLMPGLDGEQTIARMRADARLRRIPVVVVSAKDWMDGQAALATPISLHCRTPLSFSRGVACLRALLETARPDYLSDSKAR